VRTEYRAQNFKSSNKSGGTYSYQSRSKEDERTGTGDDKEGEDKDEEDEEEKEDGSHNTNFDNGKSMEFALLIIVEEQKLCTYKVTLRRVRVTIVAVGKR
jgi:hypothetical protein